MLVTKATASHAEAVREVGPPPAGTPARGCWSAGRSSPTEPRLGLVGGPALGTATCPWPRRPGLAEAFGCRVDSLTDVDMAGAHRLFAEAARATGG